MAITVGIAGITGKFARCLASHLLKHPDVSIRGYCRNASKVSAPLQSSPQVSIIQGEAFDADQVRAFVSDLDVVVCCYLGDDNLMVEGQKTLIDACEEQKVPRYIASDWSLDYTKLEIGQLWVKDPMKHVKAYLETKKVVKGVHILVGAFMDTVFSPFFNLLDAQTATFQYWGEGTEILESTSYNNAAEYTAAVARDPAAVGIQKFIGGRSSVQGIAESYEKVYKAKPTLKRLGSLEDLYKRMHALREQDPANVFQYMPLFYMYYCINGQTYLGPEVDNAKYPEIKPVSWEDFMRSHALEQLPAAYRNLARGL
ncbi:hypothetical protein BK809_0000333 [Diplodia seriata]|uniref:NAD(P)-binding domain-containing protein n=1 Tax=Diplodia seriata TaxID=420778 RepID=A0A1S8BAA5_9PEZI|nr:hypothetical protein BK809_0000333 [Diplodia seriata]